DRLDGDRRLGHNFDGRAFRRRRELSRVGAFTRGFVAVTAFVMGKSIAFRCGAVVRLVDGNVDRNRGLGILRVNGGIGFVAVAIVIVRGLGIGHELVDQTIFAHRLGHDIGVIVIVIVIDLAMMVVIGLIDRMLAMLDRQAGRDVLVFA